MFAGSLEGYAVDILAIETLFKQCFFEYGYGMPFQSPCDHVINIFENVYDILYLSGHPATILWNASDYIVWEGPKLFRCNFGNIDNLASINHIQ